MGGAEWSGGEWDVTQNEWGWNEVDGVGWDGVERKRIGMWEYGVG